jgi:hypothetical protein
VPAEADRKDVSKNRIDKTKDLIIDKAILKRAVLPLKEYSPNRFSLRIY